MELAAGNNGRIERIETRVDNCRGLYNVKLVLVKSLLMACTPEI